MRIHATDNPEQQEKMMMSELKANGTNMENPLRSVDDGKKNSASTESSGQAQNTVGKNDFLFKFSNYGLIF